MVLTDLKAKVYFYLKQAWLKEKEKQNARFKYRQLKTLDTAKSSDSIDHERIKWIKAI